MPEIETHEISMKIFMERIVPHFGLKPRLTEVQAHSEINSGRPYVHFIGSHKFVMSNDSVRAYFNLKAMTGEPTFTEHREPALPDLTDHTAPPPTEEPEPAPEPEPGGGDLLTEPAPEPRPFRNPNNPRRR